MKVRALPTCRKPVGEGAKRTRSESTDKLSFLRGVEEFGMKLTCYGRAKKRVKRLRVRIQRRMMFSAEPHPFSRRGAEVTEGPQIFGYVDLVFRSRIAGVAQSREKQNPSTTENTKVHEGTSSFTKPGEENSKRKTSELHYANGLHRSTEREVPLFTLPRREMGRVFLNPCTENILSLGNRL